MDLEMALPGLDATTKARVERTFAALKQRGITPIYVPDRRAALETVLGLIPKGSAVAPRGPPPLPGIGLVDPRKRTPAGPRCPHAGRPNGRARSPPPRKRRQRSAETAH